MEVENYVYTKVLVNRFNLIFPNSDELEKGSEFILTDWFRKVKVEGRVWQKLIWVILVATPIFLVLGVFDLSIWLVKGFLRKTWEVISPGLQTFGVKITALAALGIFGLLLWWLIASHEYEKLFCWFSQLFS